MSTLRPKSKAVNIPDDVYELIMQITRPEHCGVNSTHDQRVWADCLSDVQAKLTQHKEKMR
jgi:hypothetical protein